LSGFIFLILSMLLSILFIEAHPKGSGGAQTVVKTTEICGNIPEPDTFDLFRNKRVFIETYGCRYNFGDTAKLVEILKHKGSTFVDSAKEADAIIINTCTVVGTTERRMLRRLSSFRESDLYVTGCMPVVQREAIFAVCTPNIILSETIREAYRSIGTVAGKGVAIVQTAQGCSGRCTYCLTRLARGPLKSFTDDEILGEILANEHAGSSEIQLTAQDMSCWGQDIGKSLPFLLKRIDDLQGEFMIRVGMMNPATIKGILDDLIEAYASDHIFKFVHIPVQSGSDDVLDRMGRGYSVADFDEIVTAFRKRFPDITLATDMIVGFPGETQEEFTQSLDLIEMVRPNKVNITRYSRRPFTPLFTVKDCPEWIKKDRSRIMNTLAEKVYASINAGCLEKQVPFLVTETIKEGSVMARSPNYLGIVINENLPIGYDGRAILKKERKYFFIGKRVI
jgi:threonylcarbamoyladenosine tRNA methylthiotransferase CDKAL1